MSAGFLFGATPTQSTQAAATSLTATPASAPATGLSMMYGTPAGGIASGTGAAKTISFATPATAATTGFSFGTPAPSTGATAAPAAGFGYATPASTAAAGALTGFNLNAPATTAAGFGGIGGTTGASTLGMFGKGATTMAAAGGGIGGLGGTTGFTGLGAAATTTTTLNTGLGGSFGGIGAATKTTGMGFGLGGAAAPASAFAPAASTMAAAKGLGGVGITEQASAAVTGKSENKAVKETSLPNEISHTVEEFKKYVKSQKDVREQIARMTSRALYRVRDDAAELTRVLALVNNGLQQNAAAVDKLKHQTALELRNAEISQRTKDTPAGLQYENTAPAEYFQTLVQNFEQKMLKYRRQIEQMEQNLTLLAQNTGFTPQELLAVLHRIHESFVCLAAQLQVMHEATKVQKEQFLNYRRVFHTESSAAAAVDIFRTRRATVEQRLGARHALPPTTVGPMPFNEMPSAAAVAMATAVNRSQQPPPGGLLGSNIGQPALGNASTLGFAGSSLKPLGFASPFSTPLGAGGATGFGLAGGAAIPGFAAIPTSLATNQPFALQKPPTGGKRNKR